MDSARQARRISELTEENRALRDRIASMEAAMGAQVDSWRVPGLTPTELLVLALLMKRTIATRAQLMDVCYAARPNDAPDDKIIDVYASKIRRKLKPLGVRIENVRGVGFRIPPEDKTIIKAQPAPGASA